MDTRLVVRLVLALAVGATAAWVAAVLVTLPSASPSATIVLRTLLCLLALTLLARIVMRGAYDDPDDRTVLPRLALAAVVAYAVFPATWVGRALVGQLVVDPGPATVAIDLVLWTGVVVAAGLTVELRERRPERAPYTVD